ncbi:MAG: hypothetical protein JJE18_08060 [Eubacteriaceae bacterium]|nr:hypothetical protein [Eubacteriaceae bacterium]
MHAKELFGGKGDGGTAIPDFKINIKIYDLLRDFILRGGFEVVEKVVEEKVWYDQAAEKKESIRCSRMVGICQVDPGCWGRPFIWS